jgi:hypothetical protein
LRIYFGLPEEGMAGAGVLLLHASAFGYGLDAKIFAFRWCKSWYKVYVVFFVVI